MLIIFRLPVIYLRLQINDDKTIKKLIKTKGMALFGNHSTYPLIMEHATGVEPAYSAWEANVLPMNYACVFKLYERSLSFVN